MGLTLAGSMVPERRESDVEDLIKDIQARTGLPADKVLEVVTMVTDYMRNALPEDLVVQITQYLGSAAEQAGGAATTARSVASSATAAAASAASGIIGAASDAAGTAYSAARTVVNDATTNDDQ